MNTETTKELVYGLWEEEIVPTISEYIRIPNQSPDFDPQWAEHGYMDQAVDLAVKWVEGRNIQNSRLEVLRLEGRTPVILMEVEGNANGTVLLYGHLDKQPPFEGWREEEGLGPWTPVIKDGKLYGRGGADDGYAIFASVAAVEALQQQGVDHPRLVVLIECSEESGSPDLPYYIDAYADRIGSPKLVVCLDSGCGDYDRLWNTTSLRGFAAGTLEVKVLTEGVHSGDASGVIPSSFRILRHLLSRLENAETGEILPSALHGEIPPRRLEQAQQASKVLGDAIYDKFPRVGMLSPIADNNVELVLNRTWRPALSNTGQAGLPDLAQAGNVMRPATSVKLSMRLPPNVNPETATAAMKDLLESNPPYGATVTFHADHGAQGWEAPDTVAWLDDAVAAASANFFGNAPCSMGEGGSIPFMAMLGDKFPEAQFLITGVLGPHSNAHGPNEFLHLDCARKLTCCVAHILADTAHS
jgi:acetylornithine deacetylase/succinyl-diaminopimelate desuccinylase-like protein